MATWSGTGCRIADPGCARGLRMPASACGSAANTLTGAWVEHKALTIVRHVADDQGGQITSGYDAGLSEDICHVGIGEWPGGRSDHWIARRRRARRAAYSRRLATPSLGRIARFASRCRSACRTARRRIDTLLAPWPTAAVDAPATGSYHPQRFGVSSIGAYLCDACCGLNSRGAWRAWARVRCSSA